MLIAPGARAASKLVALVLRFPIAGPLRKERQCGGNM